MPPASAPFAFFSCQVGAEHALRSETERHAPQWRFAYSRPGFVSFKLPADAAVSGDFAWPSVLARSGALYLSRCDATTPEERAAQCWHIAGELPAARLHVWPRDAAPPGLNGFAPGPNEDSVAAEALLRAAAPRPIAGGCAEPGELVLDCVLIEPHVWWIGWHQACRGLAQWPGGVQPFLLPAHAVSRAYLKMQSALAWADFPVQPGDRCVELGCAPGGACQALLDRGLEVIGVDPAAVAEQVLAHPRFTWIRKRSRDVRRSDLRKCKWLTADMNVAPQLTLDAVRDLVVQPESALRGLLLTLKLAQWELLAELPAWSAQVSQWGCTEIRAQQLPYNRQEITLAAVCPRPGSAR